MTHFYKGSYSEYFFRGYEARHKLDGLTADNLLYLTLESNYIDKIDKSIEIEIDFEKGTIISGTREEFMKDDLSPKEVVLTEEQCQALKEYIVEYSHKVKAKEKEYWPQASEYPPMFILFRYEIRFGDSENYQEYKADGALCCPDKWDEFVKMLMEY